jgi:hypothetical protein
VSTLGKDFFAECFCLALDKEAKHLANRLALSKEPDSGSVQCVVVAGLWLMIFC